MNRAIRQAASMFALVLIGFLNTTTLPRAQAQGNDAPYEKGVTIEGITEYELKNGCKFVLFPDPSSSKVTVNMTVLVGSRHEGYGETGMAHLLEHMLFKGCKLYPNNIDKALQAHGATNANASTWTDRTNYYETMPATDENLEFGIKLEADRLVNSFIRREDLVKEMKVVRNEFEMIENNPSYILSQRMAAVAYEWHNYGKSTIGNRSDIERVPIENLHAFYKKFYQPDNVVLIVAGKFDAARAVKLIVEHFGAIPTPSRVLPQTYTEEPAQDGERIVVLRRVGKVAAVGAVYHVPAGAHDDHPAVTILSSILSDNPSGRLYKALVEKKLATDVSADSLAWHDPGLLEIGVTVAEGVAPEKVREATLEVVEGFATKPPTKAEVDRARQRYLADRERALTQSHSIARELSEWAGTGDWRLMFVYRDRIAKVTPEDVSRVAAQYMQESNRTVGTFIPTIQAVRATIPPGPDVAALVKDYKGGKELAQGEEFDPTPENLEKRTLRFTLPGGIKVALLPKKTRGEAVVGTVVLRFGNAKSLADFRDAADYLADTMMRGTKNRSHEQINDELNKLASKLFASSDLGTLSFSLQSKHKQLRQALDILRDVLREPSFPKDEFAILINSETQALREAMADPQSLASHSLRRQLSPYPRDHLRYVPTIAESLERLGKLKIEDVKRLYQEQLGGQAGEIALVGDFDVAAVKEQLESMFAGWTSSVPYERVPRQRFTNVAGNRTTIQTPDKENAVFAAGLTFAMRDSDADYPAMLLGNYILGGSGFTSRLVDRLRQNEGWSYGSGSQLRVDAQDKVSAFMAYAICNPIYTEDVDRSVLEEITRLLKSGVTEAELTAAKKGYLEAMKVSRGSDGRVAGILQEGLHLGRTFAYTAELQKKIAALEVKDVNQALAAHLDPARLVIVRAGDFTKKAAPGPKN
jgi:zinc protease